MVPVSVPWGFVGRGVLNPLSLKPFGGLAEELFHKLPHEVVDKSHVRRLVDVFDPWYAFLSYSFPLKGAAPVFSLPRDLF